MLAGRIKMTSKVVYNKLESYAYSNVFDLINTRTNITDPHDPENKKLRTFVYDSDPFEQAIDFNLVPYIVLTLPTIEYTDGKMGKSLDTEHKRISWKQMIIVRTTRHGSSNSAADVGRTDMLNICDDLHETFNSASRRDDNASMSMSNFNITKTSTDTVVLNGAEYYESEFELTYDTRIKVVA